jgi:hypothetical protein
VNAREERGLIIAALCKLNRTGENWLVPSQSGAERIYRVNVQAVTCTCPDHQEGGFKCKHIALESLPSPVPMGGRGTAYQPED